MPKFKSKFKLVGSDKQSKKARLAAARDETPRTLHFPEHTPWGDRTDNADDNPDILDTIEEQIDRAQRALDQLEMEADVLFRIDASDDNDDDDAPAAA